ncbi:MAG: hypothetical protein JO354_05080 [Verrucomicrobia bacterium]|nr:hypothetical protein [Verrucomicrobiota bacterium]
MKQRLAIVAALIVLVFCAHAPALRARFVWDDTALVLRDPLIRSWRLIPESFDHFLFTDATASNFYRPVQRLSYTAEYGAFAFRPAPYHFDNVVLHAAAVIALFFFALGFFELFGIAKTKLLIIAALASAAWALHPLHSAVVEYVSGRADSLAALFGFCGLCCLIHAQRGKVRTGILLYIVAFIALLASALSKENGLVFTGIAIALVALRARKESTIALILGVAFVVTTYFTLRMQAGSADVPRLTPPAPAIVRPIIAARALAEYSGLLVLPLHLHMERDVESHPSGLNEASLRANSWRELETIGGMLLFAGLLVWMLRSFQRNPAVFALLVFAAIAYVPVSGIFALNATMAEHWIYVPSALLLLAIGAQLSALHLGKRLGYISLAATCCWILLLGARSFVRAQDWQDERTFFSRTIAAGGDSARMLVNLGVLEMNDRHLDEAKSLFQRALQKTPEQPFALIDLGAVALKQNDFVAARQLLARAEQNPVTAARARDISAVLEYRETGKLDLPLLRLASRTGEPSWAISERYIRALGESGRVQLAVIELRSVLASEWYRADSWQLMGEYLTELGYGTQAALAFINAERFDVHLHAH